MPWDFTQTLQKRLLKFLLKRTVGQFLRYELDTSQLDVVVDSSMVRAR